MAVDVHMPVEGDAEADLNPPRSITTRGGR